MPGSSKESCRNASLGSTSIAAVSPIPTEPDLTLQPSNLSNHLLSDAEISSVLDEWHFPGVDRSQDLRETYCGLDCVAMEWQGETDKVGDRLFIVVIQHQTVEEAKQMLVGFEQAMWADGFATFVSIGNVYGDEVKNAVNSSFTKYDTIVRMKNITIQVSMDIKATPPSDAGKRGGTVITELYAQLQLDKLAAAGYFTGY